MGERAVRIAPFGIDPGGWKVRPPGVVNTLLSTNVYDVVGILHAWPGPATEVICSRQAFNPGL
jgi:hypothetical protein